MERSRIPRIFKDKLRIFIIGGGRACKSFLTVMAEDPSIEVVGLAEINPDAEAIPMACSMGIPIYTDYRKLFVMDGIDLVLNLTGNSSIEREILEKLDDSVEVLGAIGGRLLWSMLCWKEYLVTTDRLTGLYNVGFFYKSLDYEIERSMRYNCAFSLVLIDVDNFKEVNDTYGHLTGDRVLQGIAKVIKSSIRGTDVPARYGGDEFVVILPGATADGAIEVAERIREGVEDLSKLDLPHVTVSLGVSTYPMDGTTSEDLVRKADWGMYRAKKMGGNRVEYVGSGKAVPKTFYSIEDAMTLVERCGEKDKYRRSHSEMVAKLSVEIGRSLGLSGPRLQLLKTGAILHDIGKSDMACQEGAWNYVEHPVVGAYMLRHIPTLKRVQPIVLFHHERFDGKGFPKGLKGKHIPLDAQIVGFADRICRLLQNEPEWSMDRVLGVLERIRSEGSIDPDMVEKFIGFVRGRRGIPSDLQGG